MPIPDAFNPDNWFKSGNKKKTKKNEESVSETVGDSMSAISKIAIGGAVATMALGMAGAFMGAFKK